WRNTPLHVAAGHNSIKVVKYLLNLAGTENVELEAKNMYGETPLHMAAKNDCNEAAGLLLSHGASTEAKAKCMCLFLNGMTRLHLSVWHSPEPRTVELLRHCLSITLTVEGMTPLNHLSQGPGHEKLRALLNSYFEEQRKRRAIEACSGTQAKMDELEKELSNLAGLNELKLQLRIWLKGCF
nr:protein CfxQ homolog isoform X1 [Tanacetum cinerariifolium]